MPKLGEVLFGKKGKNKQVSTVSDQQQQLMDLIYQGLQEGTGPFAEMFGDFNEEAFQKGVADPALKNFRENILPQIQEKYIAGNQVLGSGMRRGQQKAAADVQSNIDQMKYQAMQDQKKDRMAMMQNLLGQRTFENTYQPGTEGLVQGAVKGVAEGVGSAAGGGIPGMFNSAAKKSVQGATGAAAGAAYVGKAGY